MSFVQNKIIEFFKHGCLPIYVCSLSLSSFRRDSYVTKHVNCLLSTFTNCNIIYFNFNVSGKNFSFRLFFITWTNSPIIV